MQKNPDAQPHMGEAADLAKPFEPVSYALRHVIQRDQVPPHERSHPGRARPSRDSRPPPRSGPETLIDDHSGRGVVAFASWFSMKDGAARLMNLRTLLKPGLISFFPAASAEMARSAKTSSGMGLVLATS